MEYLTLIQTLGYMLLIWWCGLRWIVLKNTIPTDLPHVVTSIAMITFLCMTLFCDNINKYAMLLISIFLVYRIMVYFSNELLHVQEDPIKWGFYITIDMLNYIYIISSVILFLLTQHVKLHAMA